MFCRKSSSPFFSKKGTMWPSGISAHFKQGETDWCLSTITSEHSHGGRRAVWLHCVSTSSTSKFLSSYPPRSCDGAVSLNSRSWLVLCSNWVPGFTGLVLFSPALFGQARNVQDSWIREFSLSHSSSGVKQKRVRSCHYPSFHSCPWPRP